MLMEAGINVETIAVVQYHRIIIEIYSDIIQEQCNFQLRTTKPITTIYGADLIFTPRDNGTSRLDHRFYPRTITVYMQLDVVKLNKEIKSIYTEKKKSNKNKLIQEVIIYLCCIRMVSNSDHSDPSTFANAVKFIFNTRTDTTGRLIQNCEK